MVVIVFGGSTIFYQLFWATQTQKNSKKKVYGLEKR
jgi:hypothetical protein